ncbi:MAG: methyltransferase domain-containing protein, partial [Actinomycetota bacterium]|nr:methyltransferase domain-containing protein [Actinomycetota bacterium]
LDVGCGVGALTGAIVQRCAPSAVVGIDPSEAFLRYAAAHNEATSPVRFARAHAQALPCPTATFDATVSGLTLNFLTDPARALTEMVRVTRPGGTVAAYVWDYSDPDFFLARFWAAAAGAQGARAPGDERHRWPLCSPAGLAQLADQTPLVSPRVWTLRIGISFSSPEELWAGFLLGVGPSGVWAARLRPRQQAAVRAHLEADLPVAADHSVRLTATAVAIAGSTSWQIDGPM